MPEPEVVSTLCLQHGRFLNTLFPQVAHVLRSVSQTNWLNVYAHMALLDAQQIQNSPSDFF